VILFYLDAVMENNEKDPRVMEAIAEKTEALEDNNAVTEETSEKLDDLLRQIHEALETENIYQLHTLLGDMHAADIAKLLEALPPKEREQVWEFVTPEQDGDVLAHAADGKVRASLLEGMEARELALATKNLDIDDAADILQDLPENIIEEVLRAMDAQHRQRIETVLSYDEDTAGGLMNIDLLTLRADVTLDVVFRYLRLHQELPEKTDMLLVVDRDNIYQGALFLSRLLTSNPEQLVSEVMATDVEPIPATMEEHDIARLFADRDWISAPVVDAENRLLGRITIDDVVDVIREEAEHSFLSRAGLDEEDDMFAPALTTARQRAVWLGINLITALLAAWVIGLFEATLQQIVALAVLMPIVASMGGIAGTQTLTVIVRGMALDKIADSNRNWLIRKEVLSGLLNGVLWAVVVGSVAALWFKHQGIGVIIACAIVINLAFAALSGAVLPMLLKKFKIDPALAGGVILTTITDVVGFMAFLGLATLFLL
jgi:magnesium transporter